MTRRALEVDLWSYALRMVGRAFGSYRVVAKLGEGGMGTVFLAEHLMLGKSAAIKVLQTELSGKQEMVNRFFNEARAAALLRHPGIVDVYDFGYDTSGSAYIALEFLDGETLSKRMRRAPPCSFEEIALIVRQVTLALGAAHARGIVHRDLKPDNIMLIPDAAVPLGVRVKVLDFGIAKLGADAIHVSMTHTGTILGTPIYMAPEQCRGAATVDCRADIYSLGCVLYELVCGRPPFEGEAAGEVLGKHQFVDPVPARTLNPAVSPALDALIGRMLAKAPEARPRSMEDVARALEETAPVNSGNWPAVAANPPVPATRPGAAPVSVVQHRRRAPVWIGAGLLVGLCAAAAVAFALVRTPAQRRVPEAPTPPPITVTQLAEAERALEGQRWAVASGLAREILVAEPHHVRASQIVERASRELAASRAHDLLSACLARGDLAEAGRVLATISSDTAAGARAARDYQQAREVWLAARRDEMRALAAKGKCSDARRVADTVTSTFPDQRPSFDPLVKSCVAARPASPRPEAGPAPSKPGDNGLMIPKAAGGVAPTAEQLRQEGNSLMLEDRYAQAAQKYRQAIEIAPDDGRSYYNLCTAQFQLGQLGPALKMCDEVAGAEATPALLQKTAKLTAKIEDELRRSGRDPETVRRRAQRE